VCVVRYCAFTEAVLNLLYSRIANRGIGAVVDWSFTSDFGCNRGRNVPGYLSSFKILTNRYSESYKESHFTVMDPACLVCWLSFFSRGL
jgi:hypothetical protein